MPYAEKYEVPSDGVIYTANRIRAKGVTGGVEWKDGKGFGDAVDAIPTGGGGELPSGYTKRLYTKGDGIAYVNSEITPKTNSWFEIIAIIKREANKYRQEIGTRESSNVKSWQLNNKSTHDTDSLDYSDTTNHSINVAVGDNYYNVISVNKQGNREFVADGVTKIQNLVCDASNYPFYVFGLNQANSVAGDCSKSIYFDVVFGEGDVVVAHFIPCTRNSDGEVGFYDVVRNTFYGNANLTGALIAGPAIT
ncbi:MAG: hypothetical protein K6C12_03295 [Oscillospiraceae bacterium]|nr:hypothetical protein [Oscillospiraceae bacterium]